jgi:hypothetical protein
MKLTRLFQIIAVISMVLVSCNPYEIEIPDYDYGNKEPGKEDNTTPGTGNEDGDDYPVKYPDTTTPKVKTLLTTDFFRETKIKDGITLYSAEKKMCAVTNAYQTVFVLEVDLNNQDYKINFLKTQNDTISAIGKRNKAIAAINACYEADATYVRTNGYNWPEYTISLASDHLRFWKHEAAIVGDGKRKVGIVHGAKGTRNVTEGGIQAKKMYPELTEKNIFSSSPMLIDDYDPVGSRFVPDYLTNMSDSELKKAYDGEDYRTHQGVRHPRVAVALTDDNDILFVVGDGRFSGKAEGMDANELTKFLTKHFNPRWAINMDGGGSSTMYIDGYGDPKNNVLNYPCDNKKWDHYGQRARPTVFLVEYDE